MRFAISLAFQPVGELVALAREADACGYDALAIPDHVVELEVLDTPYPYTPDGKRRWDHDADWPDPWVLTGALAQVTERIRFFTSVYVAALRSPYQVAKSVGTAAVLSGSIHAPFTSIFLVCALADNYILFIPIVVASLVSKWVAAAIFPYSVYTYQAKHATVAAIPQPRP